MSVFDVAAYILECQGPLSTWKLQKLVYYSQAWCLVWNGQALFGEQIEAWAKGPVVRDLYNAHRGYFSVSAGEIAGEVEKLSDIQRAQVDAVLNHYGSHDGQTLSELTHSESPWQEARKGLPESALCDHVIPLSTIMNYYRSKSDDAKDRLDAVFAAAATSKDIQEATAQGWDAFENGDVVAADDVLDSL